MVLNSEVVGSCWGVGRSEEVTGGEDPTITDPCHAVRSLDSVIGTEEGSAVKKESGSENGRKMSELKFKKI